MSLAPFVCCLLFRGLKDTIRMSLNQYLKGPKQSLFHRMLSHNYRRLNYMQSLEMFGKLCLRLNEN